MAPDIDRVARDTRILEDLIDLIPDSSSSLSPLMARQ